MRVWQFAIAGLPSLARLFVPAVSLPSSISLSLARPRFAFLVPLVLFLALALYQIELPGPNYDEAVEAKPAVQLLAGQPVEAHRQAVVALLGRRLPLMIVDYVGALNVYALLAYFKLGGISVASMRLWPITVGAIILWLCYRLGARAGGRRAGLLAAILLAVQPSFVFFARQGIYVTNTTIALSLGILLALAQLVRTGRLRWWLLAAFMAGLGLWAKFIMLWPLAATAALAPLAWWGRSALGIQPAAGFGPRALLRPRPLLGTLAAFLLGLAPLIVFNLKTGATVRTFAGAFGQSYYGLSNKNYPGNLLERWRQLGDFLAGDHFWYLGGNFSDILARPLWLAGLLVLLAGLVWSRRHPAGRSLILRGLCIYAFTALLLLQSPLTPTALWYTHLAIFSPYLALGIALAAESLLVHLPKRRASAAALIFAGLVLASSLRADLHYHRALAASGGYADHSDAAYRLAGFLSEQGIHQPYALDWGFDAPLILISRGQVNPIEIFGYERVDAPPDGFTDLLRPLLAPDAVFLVHAPDRTNFPGRREALLQVAAELGLHPTTLAVISERSGAPHTEVWQMAAD